MSAPEEIGKMFVGGVSSSTTEDSFCNYFSRFGEIIDSVVMKHKETGQPRGFGFITFKDAKSIDKVLQVQHHELDGKKIDPKECTPKSMRYARILASENKVFLGGLPVGITEKEIRSSMSKFGKVIHVQIMYDQLTKKSRGFGFVSFELEESMEQACAEHFVNMNGQRVECKKAEPRLPKSMIQTSTTTDYLNDLSIYKQLRFGQMMPTQQNNWSRTIYQPLFSLQGDTVNDTVNETALPEYAAAAQPVSYIQHIRGIYGTSVANYNYGLIPSSTYFKPKFTSIQTDVTLSESVKSCALNESSTESSSGPLKTAGENAAAATFSEQTPLSPSNYQRYHPYSKV